MTMRIPNSFPPEARKRLWEYLYSHSLSAGLGTPLSTCSLGAVNLALGNEVTDKIPQSMSQVIGSWVIKTQDAMPSRLRNSDGWKEALIASVDTGNSPAAEDRRLDLILQTMWGKVIPFLQPAADKRGYGEEWLMMSRTRSLASIQAATDAIVSTPEYSQKPENGGLASIRATIDATVGTPLPRSGHRYAADAARQAARTVDDYGETHAHRAYHSGGATLYASLSISETGNTNEFWEQVNPVQIFTNLAQV